MLRTQTLLPLRSPPLARSRRRHLGRSPRSRVAYGVIRLSASRVVTQAVVLFAATCKGYRPAKYVATTSFVRVSIRWTASSLAETTQMPAPSPDNDTGPATGIVASTAMRCGLILVSVLAPPAHKDPAAGTMRSVPSCTITRPRTCPDHGSIFTTALSASPPHAVYRLVPTHRAS